MCSLVLAAEANSGCDENSVTVKRQWEATRLCRPAPPALAQHPRCHTQAVVGPLTLALRSAHVRSPASTTARQSGAA